MQTLPASTPAVFNFDSHAVRTVLLDDQPWFIAADVCAALAVQNVTQALARLDADEQSLVSNESIGPMFNIGSAGNGPQAINIINESGLYNLVLGSRKPEAKRFKKWVTAEVLPAIRRTGRYQAAPEQPVLPHFVDFDQQMLLTRIMDSRGFSREWEQRAWDELHRFFQVRELERLPYNSFFDACYLIINYPKPKSPVSRTKRIAPPPAPRNALVKLFDSTKGEETRWLVVKDVHGDLHGKLLPKNSFEFDPERLAEIISEPGGLVRPALLPGILAAVAKRMQCSLRAP